jgi:RNA polymerase sigma-70 factor (ECF subfamily)
VHGVVTAQSSDPADEPSSATAGLGWDVVDLEERSWLARHCRGDTGAFADLLAAYRRPVYSYLVRTGVAAADRDDLFQNIFLKIHTAAAHYDPTRALAPWLFTVVANTVRSHFRDRPIPFKQAATDTLPDLADPRPGPERIAQDRETNAWLDQALAALPAVQREVLLLTAVAGLPQRAVATSLDLPLNTVKTHLRRTRLALAASLAKHEAPDRGAGQNHGVADEPV